MVVRNGLNYKEAGLSGIVHFVTLASTKPAGSGGDWQVEEVYGNLECNECTRKRIRKLPAMGPSRAHGATGQLHLPTHAPLHREVQPGNILLFLRPPPPIGS